MLTPPAVVIHSLGAMWGVISPGEEFEGTEKVAADTVEEVNELEDGTLAEHDGTDRLLRDSPDEFESGVFADDDTDIFSDDD